MKRTGYYAGPGATGAFTDRTANYLVYMRDHRDQVQFVELYQITLARLGTVDTATGELSAPLILRWSPTMFDFPFEGVVYAGGGILAGPRVTREGLTSGVGTGVTELDLTIALDGTDLLPPADGNSATPRFGLGEAIAESLFLGADVLYRRLILPEWPTWPWDHRQIADRGDLGPGDLSLGAFTEFRGRISGDGSVSRTKASLKVKSYLEPMEVQMPHNIYQPSCRRELYDKGCRVSRTGTSPLGYTYQFLTTVGAIVADDIYTPSPAPSHPDGWFTDGTLQFTSGAMCGLLLPVAVWASGNVTLLIKPPRRPATTDTICLQAGCDKIGLVRDLATDDVAYGTCETKFANMNNFDGEPHVPPSETAF